MINNVGMGPKSNGYIPQKMSGAPMVESQSVKKPEAERSLASDPNVSPARHLRKLSNLKLYYKNTTFGGSPRGLFEDPEYIKD